MQLNLKRALHPYWIKDLYSNSRFKEELCHLVVGKIPHVLTLNLRRPVRTTRHSQRLSNGITTFCHHSSFKTRVIILLSISNRNPSQGSITLSVAYTMLMTKTYHNHECKTFSHHQAMESFTQVTTPLYTLQYKINPTCTWKNSQVL